MKDFPTAPLGDTVTKSLNRYFKDMNGERPNNLYSLVMREVEKPMLTVVMEHTDYNQSRAAEILGINRNTLRKKLKCYGLTD